MVRELTLGEAHGRAGTPARRAGWRVLLDELSAEAGFDDALTTLRIELSARALALVAWTAKGDLHAEVDIDRAELDPLIDEYLDIVCQLGDPEKPLGVTRMEALDMAKRVVHDRAGRLLLRRSRSLGLTLESARKLFSLVVALAHDTTQLGAGLRHRRR